MLSQLKKATGSTSKYSQMSSQPAGTIPCMSTVATRSSVKASTRGLLHGGVGWLALELVDGLGGIAPTLVGGAQVVVAHGERAVRLELVHGLFKGKGGLLGSLGHGSRGGTGGNAAVAIGALVALP